jgi:hypothetical protein
VVRLSDDDRERLIDLLTRHAAAGRLSVDELERRVETVATATTDEQAAAAFSDLPVRAQTPTGPPDPPERTKARGRGHAEADAPHASWHPSAERFRDPRTGRIMRVWLDSSGGRHYVPDAP